MKNFLSSLLLDEDRAIYQAMNSDQKRLVKFALLFPTPQTKKWEFFKMVGAYSLWFFMDENEVAFYQITKGSTPQGFSGYKNLDSLLKLKGLQSCQNSKS